MASSIHRPVAQQCPHCRVENRADRYYCCRCGQSMCWSCPDCAVSNLHHEKFCGGCGIANFLPQADINLHDSGVDGRSELRQVTVLFCDVAGYTSLITRLDPEELRRVTRAYQVVVQQSIVHNGGYTARFFGDGVMAYFGFPLAHEDAARRAVDAALEINRQVSRHVRTGPQGTETLNIRIGIATGMVIAGDIIGEGAAQQYSLVGEAPNMAARIQARACPGSVLVAESTKQLLGRYFGLASLGRHRLEGFEQPVELYQVMCTNQRLSRFDALRQRCQTPMIGREKETARIESLLAPGKSQGLALVSIQGEAGIGKSRLIRECLYSGKGGSEVFKLHYQCSPSQQNNALYPVLEQLDLVYRRYLEGSLEKRIRQRLDIDRRKFWQDRVVQQWLVRDSNSHPAGAEQLQDMLIGELLFFTRHHRTVAIFEDIHWADPSTLALIRRILLDHPDLPLLLMTTCRNGFDPRWPDTGKIEHFRLQRLNPGQTRTLVSSITADTRLPAGVLQSIAEKTGGIPFFAEQLSRTVLNALPANRPQGKDSRDPAHPVYIPPTLHDMLMSKLDMLGAAKVTVQIAAVIGQRFSLSMLAALSGYAEAELKALLEQAMTSNVIEPGAGTAEYRFCHALLQEAAYESLLMSKRRYYHAWIGERLAGEPGGYKNCQAELIASHFIRAGNHSKAIEQLLAACERALTINANRELVNLASQGLSLADRPEDGRSPPSSGELYIYLGIGYQALNGLSCTEAEKVFRQAEQAAAKTTSSSLGLDALVGLHTCYHIRGDLASARQVFERSGRAASDTGLAADHPYRHFINGTNLFWSGDITVAGLEFRKALEKYGHGQYSSGIFKQIIKLQPVALANLSWIYWLQGRTSQALETADQAISLVNEFDQPIALGACLFLVSVTRVYCGSYRKASETLAESTGLAGYYEQAYLNAIMRVVEGTYLINRGITGKGCAVIDRAVCSLGRLKAGIGLPWAFALSAEALLRQGRPVESNNLLQRAKQRAEVHREFHWLADIQRIQGKIHLVQGEREQASRCFENARKTANSQGSYALELRACMDLVQIQAGRDDSQRLLREAVGKIDGQCPTPDLVQARAILETRPEGVTS